MKVTCPCCKGARVVEVLDEEQGQTLRMPCMHCEALGQVEAEERYLLIPPQPDSPRSQGNFL